MQALMTSLFPVTKLMCRLLQQELLQSLQPVHGATADSVALGLMRQHTCPS